MTAIAEKINNLGTEVASEIHERSQEIHTALLALVSRKHHFQLGPPGTAKSLLVERIVSRIDGFEEEGYFRWLLTRFTSPEEIFGGPQFDLLRETGEYKRNTARKLPRARVAFLDEIFKANSAILNSLLTAMNERQFYNLDDDPNIPLITVFSASNELAESDELWALWDRLHFRHKVTPMQESSNFVAMLQTPMVDHPDRIITLDELFEAQLEAQQVKIGLDIYEALLGLRHTLHEQGIEPTDRRWFETKGIIQAQAYLNGRDVADIEDMRPLMHVLWSDEADRKVVTSEVLSLANPIDRDAQDLLDGLGELADELNRIIAEHTDNPKMLSRGCVEVHGKLKKVKKRIETLDGEAIAAERQSEILETTKKRFRTVVARLMVEGFGVDPDEVMGAGDLASG